MPIFWKVFSAPLQGSFMIKLGISTYQQRYASIRTTCLLLRKQCLKLRAVLTASCSIQCNRTEPTRFTIQQRSMLHRVAARLAPTSCFSLCPPFFETLGFAFSAGRTQNTFTIAGRGTPDTETGIISLLFIRLLESFHTEILINSV